MSRAPGRARVTASFSSLASAAPGLAIDEREERDLDDGLSSGEPLPSGGGGPRVLLADFEASARAGSCLHEILERAQPREAGTAAFDRLVGQGLTRFGFDASAWRGPVASALAGALSTPLDAGDPSLTIAALEPKRRVAELEFLLAVERRGGVDAAAMAAAMERGRGSSPLPPGYAQAVASLGFASFEGFLKGFVDLVFEHRGRWYVADYKSNHLGDRPHSYRAEALSAEMARHHYFLQYHLYAVALHRHLRGQIAGYDYDAHFGGVFYLFLRGMSPSHGPGYGVFRDRPPAEAVEALSAALGGAPAARRRR